MLALAWVRHFHSYMSDNPLLGRAKLPPFTRIKPEHIEPAMNIVLERSRKALTELEASPPEDWSLIDRLNAIEYDFQRSWGPVGHLLGVLNSDELRSAHEKMQPQIVEFFLRLGQSQPIFTTLKKLNINKNELSPARQRTLELRLRDAQHNGIALEEDNRKRFNEIVNELSKLGTEFSNHVMDATKSFAMDLKNVTDGDGLPESLRALAAQSYNQAHDEKGATALQGPWRIGLDLPLFMPFMQHSTQRDLREKLFKAYITRASSGELDNHKLINKTLKLRKEMATLLGFANFSDLSLDSKMAGSVVEVQDLLEELRVASLAPAKAELEELQNLAREMGHPGELALWDIGFYAERLREKLYGFTDEQLRPYFPMPRVLDGLFALVGELFGVRVEAADGEASIWNADVKYFKVFNEDDKEIASFYLDPYSRPENKRGGAWMNDCVSRRATQSQLELPVAYLVCNGTPPVGDRPGLMTFSEVETLFHEFGHGLQHMLTDVDDLDVSGISGVEWDAVELPSQFMENWCYHKPTILGMSKHVDTGECLPGDLFERLLAARTFRAASGMLRQLRFSLVDLELHTSFESGGKETIFDVQHRIEEKTSLLPSLPEDRFLCSFGHIFAGGYAAGYYSYKWAEVLSADAFAAFEEIGFDDKESLIRLGRRFRNTFLGRGGSQHPMEVFVDFRGRKPTTEALLKHSGLLKSA